MENLKPAQINSVNYNYQSVSVPDRMYLAEIPNDSFELSAPKMEFRENLKESYRILGFGKTSHVMQGQINDKPVSFEFAHKLNGLSLFTNYDGYLGGEKSQITINKENITGFVGDKEVNLSVTKEKDKGLCINGYIGDKEISIQKGSSVLEAKGENDILTLCMSLFGKSIKVNNGEFTSFGMSKKSKIDVLEMFEVLFLDPILWV